MSIVCFTSEQHCFVSLSLHLSFVDLIVNSTRSRVYHVDYCMLKNQGICVNGVAVYVGTLTATVTCLKLCL